MIFWFNIGKRICTHCGFHLTVADVSVYLRGVKLLVTENIFKNTDIDLTALVHKCCGGVAELVHGKMTVFKTRKLQIFAYHPLNCFD